MSSTELTTSQKVCTPCTSTAVVPQSTQPDTCLHCGSPPTPNPVQVSCDDCGSWICQTCHWCHEYQANHSVRVCDRCDAFYCRQCDEMDQCEDCSEVVCGSCSTLMSCKFCGCGLCEDCATACGRCGIVLCARDAKFAVECDTCRMSYCLVCLAGGGKEPCVRCGHRPSKRVEQLVHLRLKSIYKAFKQSGAAITNGKDGDASRAAAAAALARAAGLPGESLDAALDSFDPRSDTDMSLAGDVGAVLQAAAQAAANNKQELWKGVEQKKQKKVVVKSRTEEEAKAAELELLAELDREEELKQAQSNKKKKKKKKKEKAKEEAPPVAAPSPPSPFTSPTPDVSKLSVSEPTPPPSPPAKPTVAPSSPVPEVDEDEVALQALIATGDISKIEGFLYGLKGVPGKAAIRKIAKKAVRRLKGEGEEAKMQADSKTLQQRNVKHNQNAVPNATRDGAVSTNTNNNNQSDSQDPKLPLLQLVSTVNMNARTEVTCSLSPSVVGWVIGKSGSRVREVMERTGCKVWIDQDSMESWERRIMYVSGKKSCVDQAIKIIKEVVEGKGKDEKGAKKEKAAEKEKKTAAAAAVANPLPNPTATTSTTVAATTAAIITTSTTATSTTTKNTTTNNPSSLSSPSSPTTSPDGSETIQVLYCEPRFVALLIGRRGWTVKHIQDTSSARVDIDQSTSPRKITISGSKESVEKAVGMVRDVLSYPNAQVRGEDGKAVPGSADAQKQTTHSQAASATKQATASKSPPQKKSSSTVSASAPKPQAPLSAPAPVPAPAPTPAPAPIAAPQPAQAAPTPPQQQMMHPPPQQQQQQHLMQPPPPGTLNMPGVPPPHGFHHPPPSHQHGYPQMSPPQLGQPQLSSLPSQQLPAGPIGGDFLGGLNWSGPSLPMPQPPMGGTQMGGSQLPSATGVRGLWDTSNGGDGPGSDANVDSFFGSSSQIMPGWGGESSLLSGLADSSSAGVGLGVGGVGGVGGSALSGSRLSSLGSNSNAKSGQRSSSVRDFLSSLDLQKYADNFAKHECDMAALKQMRAEDLADIGIPIGPRVKIMGAVQSLNDGGGMGVGGAGIGGTGLW
ncbi:hypothetical protein TrVE_jg1547 [Triparma verrucosa]|uniref:SAM domain-containing protein n=1 Tax=Triparma verrucosa TaxID=1606542 RepID=A0A9W7FMZ3_9STRA|nr:hypothetical protein TrVE_jg1547 [Triparma verrucosa]